MSVRYSACIDRLFVCRVCLFVPPPPHLIKISFAHEAVCSALAVLSMLPTKWLLRSWLLGMMRPKRSRACNTQHCLFVHGVVFIWIHTQVCPPPSAQTLSLLCSPKMFPLLSLICLLVDYSTPSFRISLFPPSLCWFHDPHPFLPPLPPQVFNPSQQIRVLWCN